MYGMKKVMTSTGSRHHCAPGPLICCNVHPFKTTDKWKVYDLQAIKNEGGVTRTSHETRCPLLMSETSQSAVTINASEDVFDDEGCSDDCYPLGGIIEP